MYKLATIVLVALVGLALSACGASPAAPGASLPTSGTLPQASTDTIVSPTSDSMAQPTSDSMAQPTSDSMAQPTTSGSVGEIVQTTVDEIAAAADDWYGKPVTVSGDVTQVYNSLAFSMSDLSTTGDPLLVIMPSGMSLSQGQSVEVSGTVQELDIAQLEQDLGITLDESLSSLAGQPVLIADQING